MRVIALGSSFAAGPGIAPQTDKHAGRSANNYPSVFVRKLGLGPGNLLDLTVSGATLANILSEPQDVGSKVFPPQLTTFDSETEEIEDTIVTITGGGNDMYYIGSMFDRTLRRTWWGRILRWFMSTEQKKALDNPVRLSPDQVTDRFRDILDHVHGRLPHASIYLVEYFSMIGPDTVAGRGNVFTNAELIGYRETAATLQDIYQKAASGREYCHIVPLAEESRLEHALGSKAPWVTGCSFFDFYRKGAYHPNAAGMRAAGERIFQMHFKLQMLA